MNGPSVRNWFGSRAQVWLGLLLGAVTLYLALRAIDFHSLTQVLREVSAPLVALTLISSLLSPLLKAIRWRFLFYPKRPGLSDTRLASLVVIGQAINFFIPARLGEVVRAYLTGEEGDMSKAYAFGTIAAEKLLDLVVLAFLVVAMLPFIALPDWLAARVGPVMVTALLVSAGVLALLGGRRLWLRLADRVLRVLSQAQAARWHARVAAGLEGLQALGSLRAALSIWGWTLAFWLVSALTNYLLLLAFHLPASPLIALFLLAVLQAGVAVPSTPGKIGVFHYLCVLGLSVFHVPAAVGFGYGLVLHFLVVGGISAWAVLALWRRSWSLRRLTEASLSWR